MHVLVTCKNEDASVKNEGARVDTTFSHYKSIQIFPDAQRQLTLQSLLFGQHFNVIFHIEGTLLQGQIKTSLTSFEK